MHRRYCSVLVAALLLALSGAALAQSMGLGFSMSDNLGKGGGIGAPPGCLLANVGSKLLADVGSCLRVQ